MCSRIREIGENIKNCPFFRGDVDFDVSLKEYTTMKVGGKCGLFISPCDIESLEYTVKYLENNKVSFFILGGGSNLVISDEGIKSAVISTHRLNSISLSEKDGINLECGSGVTIKDLIDFCIRNDIGGLENFAGLPGTAGGASFMNARCYEKNFSDYIKSIKYIDLESAGREVKEYHKDNADWAYKKSPFMSHRCFIISVTLTSLSRLKTDCERVNFIKRCDFYIEDRRQKGHFKCPSAGSVFKNNRSFGSPSGKLIDETGLKGFSIGGAQIAPWHGNFIINTGNASAKDIKDLVELVQKKVYEKTGFLLEPEIIFV